MKVNKLKPHTTEIDQGLYKAAIDAHQKWVIDSNNKKEEKKNKYGFVLNF